jgi:thiosulfate reductase cytochrome b subunit
MALNLSDQRKMAKAGMVGSLGALFASGFLRFKGARMLHPWFGWALLGFSIWHHLVSKPSAK